MKKGQITIFIILGIIILLVIGLILYLSKGEIERKIAARPSVAKVPQEVQPIYNYAEQCIYQTGKDAIKKLGERGGYITQKFYYNNYEPTEGQAVAYADDMIIPYWWHMSSANDCKKCSFENQKPTIPDMEKQISDYIALNMDLCDFARFEKQGYIVQMVEEPKFKTVITNDDVYITGKYHLRIKRGETTTDIEEFYVPFDVNVKEAYELASELTDLEMRGQYLEQFTKDLIDNFGAIDSTKLPPLFGVKITLGAPIYWIKQNIAEKLSGILSTYVQLLKANGVNNFEYVFAENVKHKDVYELLYNRQFFIPLENSYADYSLKFLYYPWWKMYFDLNCNGQLCTADVTKNTLMFLLGFQEYKFAYDASYPVLVQLRADEAFKGEGFTFQFFLEENIRNNKPLQGAELIDLPFQKTPSIFCNPDLRHSGELIINVRNEVTGDKRDYAAINYRCLRETCSLGETKDGMLKTKLPTCIGGLLTINKEGYLPYAGIIDSDFEEDRTLNAEMQPEMKIKLTAKKYEFSKLGKFTPWQLQAALGGTQISEGEQVLVTMKRKSSQPLEAPYSVVAALERGQPAEIGIVPGTYEARITSVLRPKQALIIPPDRRCQDIPSLNPFTGFTDEEYYTVPKEPIIFDEQHAFPYGGAEIEFTILPQQLKNKNVIELKYFTFALDKIPEKRRVIEDMNEFGKVETYSKSIKNKLEPVIM